MTAGAPTCIVRVRRLLGVKRVEVVVELIDPERDGLSAQLLGYGKVGRLQLGPDGCNARAHGKRLGGQRE